MAQLFGNYSQLKDSEVKVQYLPLKGMKQTKILINYVPLLSSVFMYSSITCVLIELNLISTINNLSDMHMYKDLCCNPFNQT